MRCFWDEERRAFINGFRSDGTPDQRISHHAQFWGILMGLFPPEHYDHYFDTILPSLAYHRQTYSIEKGYEFLAYVATGRTGDLMRIVKDVWGNWVQEGFSRFPENIFPAHSRTEKLAFYDRPYGLSLCPSLQRRSARAGPAARGDGLFTVGSKPGQIHAHAPPGRTRLVPGTDPGERGVSRTFGFPGKGD